MSWLVSQGDNFAFPNSEKFFWVKQTQRVICFHVLSLICVWNLIITVQYIVFSNSYIQSHSYSTLFSRYLIINLFLGPLLHISVHTLTHMCMCAYTYCKHKYAQTKLLVEYVSQMSQEVYNQKRRYSHMLTFQH